MEADRDGRDSEATHIVAVEDGRVIGTCRLLYRGPVARLGRLAVEPDRGNGVAAAILERAEEAARDAGADAISSTLRPTPWSSTCGRLRGAGSAVRRGGHRARGDGEAALPELRIDPLSGPQGDRRGRARIATGRLPRRELAREDRSRDRSLRGRPRGPHPARGVRPARERLVARPGGAEPLPRAFAREAGDATDPLAAAGASPTCSPASRPWALTR